MDRKEKVKVADKLIKDISFYFEANYPKDSLPVPGSSKSKMTEKVRLVVEIKEQIEEYVGEPLG